MTWNKDFELQLCHKLRFEPLVGTPYTTIDLDMASFAHPRTGLPSRDLPFLAVQKLFKKSSKNRWHCTCSLG